MIGYLSGLIIDVNPDKKTLLVLTQGVGYMVSTTSDVTSRVHTDEKIQLYIHTAVREDNISLYGFLNKAELTFFNQLIDVSGIGPKMALDILSTPIHMIQSAILGQDVDILTQIKGIGRETAERMILELKNKIVPTELTGLSQSTGAYNNDAVLALQGLGYEKFYIIKVLSAAPKELKDTEDMVKYFLKQA